MHGQRVDPTQRIGLFEHAGEGFDVRLRGGVGIAGGLVAVEDEAVPTENRGVVADGREGVGGFAIVGVEGETRGQIVLVSEKDPLAFLGVQPSQKVSGLGGCVRIHRGNGRGAGARFGNAGGATRRCKADEQE